MKWSLALTILPIIIAMSGCSSTPKRYQSLDLRPLPCFWEERDQQMKFAKEYASLAIAANAVYAKDTEWHEAIPFPATEAWTEIGPIHTEDCIGFAAQAWTRTKNGRPQLVIAFRGTTDFRKDFPRGNLVFVRGLYRTQFDAALEFTQETISNNPSSDIVLVGHSLGAGLAEYCQRFTPNSQTVGFDSSPNRGLLYSLGQPKGEKHTLRLFERGEILRPFRWISTPTRRVAKYEENEGTRALWFDFMKGNYVTQHSMAVFTMNLIKLAVLAKDEAMIDVLKQIEADREVRKAAENAR